MFILFDSWEYTSMHPFSVKSSLIYLLSIFWLATLYTGASAVICLPAFGCGCSKGTSVKANMHTLQTALESYFVDHQRYPQSLEELVTQAKEGEYWKAFINPFKKDVEAIQEIGPEKIPLEYFTQEGRRRVGAVIILGIPFYSPSRLQKYHPQPGQVLFEPRAQGYFIYGTAYRGELIRDKGLPFTLSNH
jgi:hypothetical protein